MRQKFSYRNRNDRKPIKNHLHDIDFDMIYLKVLKLKEMYCTEIMTCFHEK